MTDLPKGWRRVPLVDAADVTLGQSPPGHSYNDTGEGVPFFQGKTEFTKTYAEVRKYTTAGTKFAMAGDILISVRAPVGPTNLAPVNCAIGRGLAALRAKNGVDHRYLHWALRATEHELAAHGAGTTFPAVTGKQLKAHPIALPASLEDQRRIVAILDDHASRLDAADAYLDAGRRRAEKLLTSLLSGYFQGPTSSLSSLARSASYGTSTKCVVSGPGPAVVRIPNLVAGKIDLTDEKRVADASVDVRSAMLDEGDLLIVRTNGSIDLIGRSAVVQDGVDAAFASYLIRYQVRRDLVRPQWIQAMLSAPQMRRRMESLAASSAGQYNLSLAKLNPLDVPVPPLEEQDRRLAHLADATNELARLRAAIDSTVVRSSALRRSLLSAAVSGQLN